MFSTTLFNNNDTYMSCVSSGNLAITMVFMIMKLYLQSVGIITCKTYYFTGWQFATCVDLLYNAI